MHPILGPVSILFVAIFLAYFWSFKKLYKIVSSEKPEWIAYKGSPSIFYHGLPKMSDPNVSLRVIGIAFSAKSKQLTSPDALWYSNAVRVLLSAGLLLFIGILVFIFSRGGL